jgi:hypothetical protein
VVADFRALLESVGADVERAPALEIRWRTPAGEESQRVELTWPRGHLWADGIAADDPAALRLWAEMAAWDGGDRPTHEAIEDALSRADPARR